MYTNHGDKTPHTEDKCITVLDVSDLKFDGMLGYKNLCFTGGGGKGFVYFGALKALTDFKLLNKFECFAGSSAGAMSAVFAALLAHLPEKEHEEIYELIQSTDFNDLIGICTGNILSRTFSYIKEAYELYEYKGLHNGDKLKEFMSHILEYYLREHSPITFKRFKEITGKSITITATCVQGKGMSGAPKTIYFSDLTTPDVEVSFAVRASVSIPGVFVPVSYDGGDLIDGGTLDNYPLNAFDYRLASNGEIFHFNTKTLGLTLVSGTVADAFQPGVVMKSDTTDQPLTFAMYAGDVIGDLCDKLSEYQRQLTFYRDRTIDIYTGDLSTLNFNLTREQQLWAMESGYSCVATWLVSMLGKMRKQNKSLPSFDYYPEMKG